MLQNRTLSLQFHRIFFKEMRENKDGMVICVKLVWCYGIWGIRSYGCKSAKSWECVQRVSKNLLAPDQLYNYALLNTQLSRILTILKHSTNSLKVSVCEFVMLFLKIHKIKTNFTLVHNILITFYFFTKFSWKCDCKGSNCFRVHFVNAILCYLNEIWQWMKKIVFK